jgi:hypothetical protein
MTIVSRLIFTVAAALLLPSESFATAANDSRSWVFSVLLDGDKIGYHRFELRQKESQHEVHSEASFDVRVFFITAFRYRHSNREIWDDGCLERIESRTRQNGDRQSIVGIRVDNAFILNTGETQDSLEECVMTFAYWNPDFLGQSHLLNPQTGEYLPVEIEPLGTQPIKVRGKEVAAAAYRLVANKLELTVWYSDENEWLGLESIAKGGRIIRYVLT